MSRTSSLLTTILLVVVLVVLAVPVALNLSTSAQVGPPPAAPALPAAAQAPATLSQLTGISALSDQAPTPSSTVLGPLLDEALATTAGDFTGTVRDALTGNVLYDRKGSDPRIPASNLKLMTAVAALKTLGADRRFDTTVLQKTPGTLILKGGGDSLLAPGDGDPTATVGHAGIATLAANTAAALKKSGYTGPVTLSVDDSLFSGPTLNPHWLQGDLDAGQVAPVFPLAIYGARFDPNTSVGDRPQDSAMEVAQVLAKALTNDGVQVAGVPTRGSAEGASKIASVQSATVADQVEYMLQASDNYVAEVMARMTAVGAGKAGTYSEASATVQDLVAKFGVSMDGLVMADASGLAPEDRISANQLAALIKIMLTDSNQDLRTALAGLPIAGLSGTLGDRYMDKTTAGGAGLVRAKTGTLNADLSLTGYVIDADGRLLVFSFLGNNFADGSNAAKPLIDRAASILAGCGCK